MATIALTPSWTAGRPSATAGPTVRLTRRGRLVVAVLALLLVVGVGLSTAGRVAAGTPAQAPALESVVVQPGETLWAFARQAMPGTDTREAVLRIRELNALPGNVIRPGQVLVVPAS